MRRTFGQFNSDKGEGQLRPISFPTLMKMDQMTGDGRMFLSAGGGSRELPLSIMAQTMTSFGHDGAVAVGSLQEATFEDDGNVSGRGWLADTPFVNEQLVPLLVSKSLRHNSVDLADATVEIQWKSDDPNSPDFWDYDLVFPSWALAATTILSVPAFGEARMVLSDELTAALTDDSEIVVTFDDHTVTIDGNEPGELTASLAVAENLDAFWADFYIPENPDHATPICVDAEGRVFGNLADWDIPHGTTREFCPRPASYDNFHKANAVLTERGFVDTGPIFFLGGHPDHPIGNSDPNKAYGGVENAWADVRVTNGRHGPWLSGRIRPGLSPEALYVARASQISGHWTADRTKLVAIVSVNVPAFNVPGTKLSWDRGGAVISEGKVLELVASLHEPRLSPEKQAGEPTQIEYNTASDPVVGMSVPLPTVYASGGNYTVMQNGKVDTEAIAAAIVERLGQATKTTTETVTLGDDSVTVETTETVEVAVDVIDDEAERLAIELDLDELDDDLAFDDA